MIDTHCHLTYEGLSERLTEVLQGAASVGVDRMITVGTTPADAFAARGLAESHASVWFSAGVHPHYAAEVSLSDLPELMALATHKRCVALGELGLDYHYDDPPRKLQHEFLSAQLEAIRYADLDKPVIVHCRKAVDDTLAILKGSGLPLDRFVFHCFTESPDDARKVLDVGAWISFTGIVTYKNAPEVRESARLVPHDRIMVETDAPYLSPEPHRKIRPNEPRFVVDTARFLADLRDTPFAEFVRQADANADRFFGIPAEDTA